MTTLRRELRARFYQVLGRYLQDVSMSEEDSSRLVDDLADAALELRGFSLLQNADPAWTILAGQDVTEEQVKSSQLRDVAPKMFEKALGFSKPLPWWDGDKDWREFGEWVCAEYEKDKSSFGRYNIWRNTPYTKGGMSNPRLRGFPAEFYDSWDMFKMAQPKKTDEQRPEYKPVNREEDKHAIPNPYKKPASLTNPKPYTAGE